MAGDRYVEEMQASYHFFFSRLRKKKCLDFLTAALSVSLSALGRGSCESTAPVASTWTALLQHPHLQLRCLPLPLLRHYFCHPRSLCASSLMTAMCWS